MNAKIVDILDYGEERLWNRRYGKIKMEEKMKKVPCEIIVWKVVPCIRRAFAISLFEKGLNQKKIADIIGVSNAAISQYLASKRGKNIEFSKKLQEEIEKSVKLILNGGDAIKEICRICEIVKKDMGIKELC